MSDIQLTKLSPQSLENEQAVLGSMILDKDQIAVCRSVIRGDMMYAEKHETIFNTICELDDSGKPVDMVTLIETFDRKGLLEKVGGPAYLVTLIDCVPTPKSAENYAKTVYEKWILRSIIKISNDVINNAYNQESEPTELIEGAGRSYLELLSTRQSDDVGRISNFRESFDNYYSTEPTFGVTTGFPELDHDIYGWQPGDLIVLMGRPETYKTFLMLYWAYKAYLAGEDVLIIELEMNRKKIKYRLEAFFAKINSTKIKRKELDEDELRIYMGLEDVFSTRKNDIYILTRKEIPLCTPSIISAKIKQIKPRLVLLDSVLSMDVEVKVGSERERVVRNVRSLKKTAEAQQVPIIALHHTSKQIDKASSVGKPSKDASMESDVIAQDSDIVFQIQRNELLDSQKQVFLGSAKCRDSQLRNFLLFCDMSIPQFSIDMAGEGDILKKENSDKPERPKFLP